MGRKVEAAAKLAERTLHERRRYEAALAQKFRCARCGKSIAGEIYDLLVDKVFDRSCRLKEDAPRRVAKAIETRRARAAQARMFSKVWFQGRDGGGRK